MKELSIEEKAKRYDEVIPQLKGLLDGIHEEKCGIMEEDILEIFPELKESECESIRKRIIATIHLYYGEPLEDEAKEMIDWLEKQGGQSKKVSIWKHWKDGIAGNGEGEPIYLIKDGYTYSINSCLCFECDYIELSELDKLLSEKQGEQNPVEEYNITGISSKHADGKLGEMIENMESANKVEPKDCSSIDPYFGKPADKTKQEWSMFDKTILKAIIDHFEYKKEFNEAEDYDIVNWLKSLRPQNRWKPSDEQMVAIQEAMNIVGVLTLTGSKINSLYQDLKKLREE